MQQQAQADGATPDSGQERTAEAYRPGRGMNMHAGVETWHTECGCEVDEARWREPQRG